jgi:Tol biopolymer transport system component
MLLTYDVGRLSGGDHPKRSYGLCLARPDGSHAVRFAPFQRNGTRKMIVSRAAWSSNGKEAALVRGRYLVVVDARGHVLRRLYKWEGYSDRAPVWSPDGRWIAVVTGRLTEITVLPARTKGKPTVAVRLPFGAAGIESPSWTPNSKRIAFFAQSSSPSAGKAGIYSVARTGKDMRLVVPGAEHRDPELSPDGSKLAFVVADVNGGYVAVANSDGSSPHPIGARSAAGDLSPTWSPDGGMIAYWRAAAQSLAGGIVAARADGSGETLVARDRVGFSSSEPSWRPAAPLPAAKRAPCSP